MGIGAKLQDILNANNSNPNDLAMRIGITPSTIYSIIKRDNTKVDIEVLLKICREFNVSVEEFYNANHSNNRKQQKEQDDCFKLSPHEKKLVLAYRQYTDFQAAIDSMLHIEHDTTEKQAKKIGWKLNYS